MRVVALIVVLVALSLLGFYVYDRVHRCTLHGVPRKAALPVAEIKLRVTLANYPSVAEFKLIREQFDKTDDTWVFDFQENDCEVSIIIDKCGVSDVGGLSKGCLNP